MGVIGDICRKVTGLSTEQIEQLEQLAVLLGIAADLSHAQITVYTKTKSKHFLAIVAQVRPNTSFIEYRPHLLGTTVRATEEPLVWRTMTCGEHISGQREWEIGMDVLEMETHAIRDKAGTVIAVVSFEASHEEARAGAHPVLVEMAFLLLSTSRAKMENIFRRLNARDGIIIVGESGHVVFSNAVAASIYKVLGVGRVVGRRVSDRRSHMKVVQKAIAHGVAQELEIETGDFVFNQRAIPVVVDEKVIRTLFIVSDVTEIKKKEKELLIKSAVIQEIHHRVKNNLQTIASLLSLQARRSSSADVKASLKECINRILSISVIHEFLSQQDVETINVAEVAKNILDSVIQNMMEPDFNIQTVFNGETVILPSDCATSLALAINELIQNSIEHGFVGRREGIIGIDIRSLSDCYQIEIFDNGIGLPPGFDAHSLKSLGIQIITTLIESDLSGKFELKSDGGTRAIITIPHMTEGEGG
ncbi:two-component sensor histidine kinase/PAS domain-containing protein [Sporomusaceae bacterium BoRhaA]|uniref:sensor histidine kinase n=1 Tax=Pelorhabdus rhamnosifermentans TaxID=2772457 RepID=UPI001C063088|nr:histidine kinase N-terminal domain-containing protein [Pelorhabdus rhamnosifermentans]MBU2702917.1 two-component sensor histidine kinase/PAS domain-containing protein [Pelorhabdus rhamnosifermentans]